MEENSHHFVLRLLIIITDKPLEKKVLKIWDELHIPVWYEILGKGTAGSEFLEICGLNETARVITIGVIPKDMVSSVFWALEENLKITEKGKGIAFTIPVNGIQSYLLKKLDKGQQAPLGEKTERNEQIMKEENAYVMILISCNQGYSGEVMEAASYPCLLMK